MSKIKYPSHCVGSNQYCQGFAQAIAKVMELNPDTGNTDHLLDTIGALHTRNKGLQKGHATLTRRVQELEAELDAAKQDFMMRAFDPLAAVKACQGSREQFEALLKAPMDMAVATGTLSDRAVDAIIADVMKPEPTAADQRLADDIYSLRRRIACNLHEWEQQAVDVLSRLAEEERRKRLENARRRGE